ncbi:ABC transporter permease [Acuticoccus sp. M5D2P5]|uniref:ABC transporter permease n=1 Tax=Acuticoccus kalidii TaxID=2910977 RepID=UPI001F192404|nr:ABC transporter permease [Acuticoccus kalidii]MCF3933745.1 ABC transporter permease [Acuticoccus kalidii]
MRAKRLLAIARKEVLQIVRDPRSLMIALLMPFLQMFLLGYGISLDLKHVPVCVFDRERSQTSEDLVARFEASAYFAVTRRLSQYAELTDAIDRRACVLALVIPPDFSERLAADGTAPVQAILDATDTNTATIAYGYAANVLARYSAEIGETERARQGETASLFVPVEVDSRVWFNEDLESRNFIIPGLVAVILALVGAQLTALTIAREWERGTMELLISTPVTATELMVGKLAPYLVLGWAVSVLCLLLAVFWFAVPFRGTIGTIFVTTTLFLLVVIGIGYLVSALIRDQLGASQVALIATILPANLLSGYIFPIDQMPAAVQAITYLVYTRYYVEIVKAVFLKGSGLAALALPVVFLAVYAAAVLALAALAFRKRLR